MNQNHNQNLYWYLYLVEQGLLEFKINLVLKMLNLNSMILILFKYEMTHPQLLEGLKCESK
jgi:hypothetical protein